MIYTMYKGGLEICTGTIRDLAEILRVRANTVRYYTTSEYKQRIALGQVSGNYITLKERRDLLS